MRQCKPLRFKMIRIPLRVLEQCVMLDRVSNLQAPLLCRQPPLSLQVFNVRINLDLVLELSHGLSIGLNTLRMRWVRP